MFGILTFVGAAMSLAAMGTGMADDAPVLRIQSGDMMEITTDTVALHPDFSWILTKDRVFQNAQRNRFFQARPAQTGTYNLDASIQDHASNANEYQAFTILVTDPVPASVPATLPPPPTDATPLQAMIQTDPPLVGGALYVPSQGGIVKIDPSISQGKINAYDIDLDSSVDSDGDGNPLNDKDTAGTQSEHSGTPFYVYFKPKVSPRSMTLAVTNLVSPTPSILSINIVFGTAPEQVSSASSVGVTPTQNGPIQIEMNELSVHFSAHPDDALVTGKQLLYEWDFGDHTRSLLTRATHTYDQPGNYTVTLSVLDLQTGQVLLNTATIAAVTSSATNPSNSSSSTPTTVTSSSSSSQTSSTTGSSSFPLKSILYVGFIIFMLLAFAIALYVVFVFIKRKAAGRIQETLEKMEKTIVKSDTKDAIVEGTVEPMKLKKEEKKTAPAPESVREKELEKTDFKSQTRTNETPASSAGPVPSWLAKAQTTTPAATPAPKPPAPPVAPAATPAPKPQPRPAAEATPDWLRPAPTETKKEVPAPAAQTEAPLAKADAPVPDWLKPKPTAAPTPTPAPKPATATAPAPVVTKTVTTSTPAATPASTPKPASAPAPTTPPKPVSLPEAPKTSEVPVAAAPKAVPMPPPTPKQTLVSEPKPEPKAVPTPEAPKPATNNVPPPAPKPPAPAATPAPTPAPIPVPQPEVKPAPAPAPQPQEIAVNESPDDDETIAIISADSLTK